MNHQIIFIQFTNPAAYPPIQNAARIFKGKGWSVAFLSMVTSSSETKRMSFDTVSQAHFYWVRGTAVRMLLPMIYVWFCLKAVFIIFFTSKQVSLVAY